MARLSRSWLLYDDERQTFVTTTSRSAARVLARVNPSYHFSERLTYTARDIDAPDYLVYSYLARYGPASARDDAQDIRLEILENDGEYDGPYAYQSMRDEGVDMGSAVAGGFIRYTRAEG